MYAKILIVSLFFPLLFTACGTAVKPADLQNADYGEYPTNYEQLAKNWFENEGSLRDPWSAKYRFHGNPIKAYNREAPITGGAIAKFGYLIYVDVNAKNGFGGYTGWEEYRLFVRNGEILGRIEPNMYFEEPWYQEP